jgi:uncharacterized protein (DUF305 family)
MMSLQAKHTRSNRSIGLPRVVAMVLAITVVPALTTAHEPEKNDKTSMPGEQMDHSGMGKMSMTGDVDYDFAANMRMHHMKAVEMSQAELKNGKDPQILQMAKDIIAAQKKEIAAFDQWMREHKKD